MSFQDQENTQQSTDQLTFSVGERSFNAESAATKIEAADSHIKTIEQENQEYKDRLAALEAQVAQSTKIDDALAKLQQQQSQESQATEVTPSVSEEQIGASVAKQMEDYLAKQRAEEAQRNAQTLSQTTFEETGAALQLFMEIKLMRLWLLKLKNSVSVTKLYLIWLRIQQQQSYYLNQ